MESPSKRHGGSARAAKEARVAALQRRRYAGKIGVCGWVGEGPYLLLRWQHRQRLVGSLGPGRQQTGTPEYPTNLWDQHNSDRQGAGVTNLGQSLFPATRGFARANPNTNTHGTTRPNGDYQD